MNEKQKVILKVMFLTLIPVILNYLAKSENCLDYFQQIGIIGTKVRLEIWKDVFLISASVFTAVFLSIRLACMEIEKKTIANQRHSLIKYNKEIFTNALESKLQISNININIRIFVPRKGILLIVKKILEKSTGGLIKSQKEFTVRNIEGLSDTGVTGNLTFGVYPKPQGLVGSCYEKRTIVYDENFKKNSAGYNLTDYQISKTRDMEFCLCAPIFNEKGDIISIVSFDSIQRVNISKVNKMVWIDMITNYCQFLSDYLPDLFR